MLEGKAKNAQQSTAHHTLGAAANFFPDYYPRVGGTLQGPQAGLTQFSLEAVAMSVFWFLAQTSNLPVIFN